VSPSSWLIALAITGAMILVLLHARRRLHLWPVLLLYLAGDSFRTFGGFWSAGIDPGSLGGAYSGGVPLVPGYAGLLVYGSWLALPFLIIGYAEERGARVAGITVLVDGFIHMVLPFQPPWMTGVSERWISTHPILGSGVNQDVNAMAAMPSLHVALPVSQGWYKYAALMGVTVVLLGEHWAIDVAAGWVLGLVVRAAVYPRVAWVFDALAARTARWWPARPPVRQRDTRIGALLTRLAGAMPKGAGDQP